jgi:hypothetical protein
MIWIPICGTLLKQEVGTAKSGLYNNWAKYWILRSVLMNTIKLRYRRNTMSGSHGLRRGP